MAKFKQYPIAGLAEKLTDLCYEHEIPAWKLGVIAGNYNRKTVYGWLHDDTVINSLALTRICKFFNVSADWLLGLKEDDKYSCGTCTYFKKDDSKYKCRGECNNEFRQTHHPALYNNVRTGSSRACRFYKEE